MPDRVIRDELLESERWLTLKDNADRLAYISLLLKADDYGNYSAEPYRLMRMWRDFGISTIALVSKTLSELSDHDLVRLYDKDRKPYLHLPRFKNARRYWSRKFPKSPFNEQSNIESNQEDEKKPTADLRQTCANPSGGVGVGVGVEVGEKPKALSGKPDVRPLALEVLEYLNTNTGKQYRPVDSNIKLIEARLRSGATPLQMKEVIFSKCEQWLKDEKMVEYLRPKTLFNATNFEQYLGEFRNEVSEM